MLNKLLSSRWAYFIGFIVSFGLVVFALYIQTKDHLEPCPLCISQRIIYMVYGLIALLATFHHPKNMGRKIYALLLLLTAVVGVVVASRHWWIQANPEKVMAECGAGFDYIFETFPFKKALDLVFKGTGECSTIDWTWLGLTIPQLSLACFLLLAVYALLLGFKKRK
jgi:protein dithiol:quinone oxidoreductase